MHISPRLTCCLLFIILSSISPAAVSAATIRGQITTEQGKPITGVDVTLYPRFASASADNLHREARSDSDGRFAFEGLPDGSYQLQFSKRYWQPVSTHLILTGADRTIEIEMAMTLLFATLAKVQLMSFAYGVMLGIALLWLNYYLAPVPVKTLTYAGWAVIAFSLALGAIKLEPVHTLLLAFGGIVVGWYIQRRGNHLAEERRVEIDREQEQRREAHEQERRVIASLVGKEGVALTHLKACGMAEVDGRSVEVRAQNGFIDKDTPIIVRALEGSMPVVVAKITCSPSV